VFETQQGTLIWQSMDESAYAWKALKTLPEGVRDKKDIQLELNLAEIMETLADGLIEQQSTEVQHVETYGVPMTTAASKKQ